MKQKKNHNFNEREKKNQAYNIKIVNHAENMLEFKQDKKKIEHRKKNFITLTEFNALLPM